MDAPRLSELGEAKDLVARQLLKSTIYGNSLGSLKCFGELQAYVYHSLICIIRLPKESAKLRYTMDLAYNDGIYCLNILMLM